MATFNPQAVSAVIEQGHAVRTVAREYGIPESTLRGWIKKARAGSPGTQDDAPAAHAGWDSISADDATTGNVDDSTGSTQSVRAKYDDEVSHPGKFEGCAPYVPFYWDVYLNGFSDDDNGVTLRFDVSDEDRAIFPELNGVESVFLEEDSNGFVNEVNSMADVDDDDDDDNDRITLPPVAGGAQTVEETPTETPSRYRTVLPDNHTVAHYWANQTQPEGRTSNGNFSFRGPALYSYSTCVAYLRRNARGETAAIFTARSYSVTTSGKHVGPARSAARQHVYFSTLADPSSSPERIRENMVESLNAQAEAVPNHRQARIRAQRYGEYFASIGRANDFCRFFDLPEIPQPAHQEDLEAYLTEQAKERSRIERERKAKTYAEATERLNHWLAGEDVSPSGITYILGHDAMRLEGDEVVTTQYARVPADHVRRFAPMILRAIHNGETYQHNPLDRETKAIRLGHYTLSRIDEDGTVTVGCHRFPKEEIERFAAVLDANPVACVSAD